MKTAVLICNGPSAEGYHPPEGAFVLCLNDGFTRHRADAALTVDCPESLRAAWSAFGGRRVLTDATPAFGQMDEMLEGCEPLMRRYHSSAACGLAWLAGQGFATALVVGMDALGGGGKPGAAYTPGGHAAMLAEFAPKFPGGLRLLQGGKEVAVGPGLTCPTRPTGRTPQTPTPKPQTPECSIPQTLVEFDVSPRCTRACKFCAPGIPAARRRQRRCLTLKAHDRAIDGLIAAGYNRPDRWLCYCGHGEPLLNPRLFAMIRSARAYGRLSACRVAVYTNGDRLDVEACCTLEALDVEVLIWNCYDQASADRVPGVIAASSLDPARVRVNDYREGFPNPSSRCSSVRKADPAAWKGKPCAMPDGKLFFTDDGKGGSGWLLCCEDYARKSLLPGKLSPLELNAHAEFSRVREGLLVGRRGLHPICRRCDRDGTHPDGFAHVPALVGSAFWPAPRPAPAAPAGRRLVVLPANMRWAGHARAVLDAIDRASVVPGETMVIWNDDGVPACPEYLRGERRIVRESGSLGWCGISRGIGGAFRYALERGYDWVIKLDTDTAVLRRGWDALLCAECPSDAQLGTYMDVSITGQFPDNADCLADGLFNANLKRHCRWARRYVARGLRKWDHMQGGCYVLGREALARIDRVAGLDAGDQEDLPEPERVGEDVYVDTKVKLARVPQRNSLRLRIWFRESGEGIRLEHVRYQRDVLDVVAVHPVKDLEVLKTLAGEIA